MPSAPQSPNGKLCLICMSELQDDDWEAFSCGRHKCCTGCAQRWTRERVEKGKMPNCCHCEEETDPLLALRLLGDAEDLKEKFLQLSLWSNELVEACPKCRCLLMMDEQAVRAKMGQCPACNNIFCTDCKCDFHPGKTCEEAMSRKTLTLQSLDDGTVFSAKTMKSSYALPNLDELEDEANVPVSRRPNRSISVTTFEKNMLSAGCKVCPRCGAGVLKADDGCDHMTCEQCKHQFCWTCLADRTACAAHGNHHHRPGCKFHAPWSGQDRYLPGECRQCKLAGRACRAPTAEAAIPGTSVLLDAIGRWWNQGLFSATCNRGLDLRRTQELEIVQR